ncbi:hypothetical protein ILUMI_18010 [Ignelater luminosus]|uniref:Uncharacterized protein n=1 Tax=Ignelater luminosus TaxID=2038154 RepID=A0A8K0G7C0_IGNLU|nr:hypothetical protein ILUMI_18010 [Ignelater luminosus]
MSSFPHCKNMKSKEKRVQIIVVGEGGIGKTCLVIRYAEGRFPEDYIPTQFCTEVDMTQAGITYKANIIDSGGNGEDFYRLRPIYYRGANVVVMCFALNSKWSFDGLLHIWNTEIQFHLPETPMILVGELNQFCLED